MIKIESFVFFATYSKGLANDKRRNGRIEFSFVAALRQDLERTNIDHKLNVKELKLLINRPTGVDATSAAMTDLYIMKLKNAPEFQERTKSLLAFLEELPKPLCLVAHNVYVPHHKLLLTYFDLPGDLLCVDSLSAFRKIYNRSDVEDSSLNIVSSENFDESLIISSFIDFEFDSRKQNLNSPHRPLKHDEKMEMGRQYVKLGNLYKKIYNIEEKVVCGASAVNDCFMLLQCVIATKEFISWSDQYCKQVSKIQPLISCN